VKGFDDAGQDGRTGSRELSSGIDPLKERSDTVEPDVPFYTENLLFAISDPASDVGMWLHTGTVPNDWTMWEDRVVLTLPQKQGVLSMWGYYRTRPQDKPGGPNLSFHCIEPFKRWRVTFDGYAHFATEAAMLAGLVPDGSRKRLRIDLDIRCVSAVWDAEAAAAGEHGHGDMASQGWAKEHYEQIHVATGVIQVDDSEISFNGSGWRDHSRGPRGGGTGSPWGGHVIAGGYFPSGRSFILSRYWDPSGRISLEGGCYTEADGAFRLARVSQSPQLRGLIPEGERLEFALRGEEGDLVLDMTTRRSLWMSMTKQLALGRDLGGPGLMYVVNFGPCRWGGETGEVYIERSNPLNALPESLFHQGEGIR
jgi:hypothetical protein